MTHFKIFVPNIQLDLRIIIKEHVYLVGFFIIKQSSENFADLPRHSAIYADRDSK